MIRRGTRIVKRRVGRVLPGKAWEEVLKRRRPNATILKWFESSCHSLRDRLKNSNYILLKIPIEIHNLGHGERLTCMDCERLPEELGLDEQDIEGLSHAGLVRRRPQKPRPKERIDYAALQQTYRRMLAEGPFSNQTELARHLGISRVWVSRVLKGIKRTAR